jgi:hypothetical protein
MGTRNWRLVLRGYIDLARHHSSSRALPGTVMIFSAPSKVRNHCINMKKRNNI